MGKKQTYFLIIATKSVAALFLIASLFLATALLSAENYSWGMWRYVMYANIVSIALLLVTFKLNSNY